MMYPARQLTPEETMRRMHQANQIRAAAFDRIMDAFWACDDERGAGFPGSAESAAARFVGEVEAEWRDVEHELKRLEEAFRKPKETT